jgi:hypothetical protein
MFFPEMGTRPTFPEPRIMAGFDDLPWMIRVLTRPRCGNPKPPLGIPTGLV